MSKNVEWIHVDTFKRTAPVAQTSIPTQVENSLDSSINNHLIATELLQNALQSLESHHLPRMVEPDEVVLLIQVWLPKSYRNILCQVQVLSSQPLTVLRDAIQCINDFACFNGAESVAKTLGLHLNSVEGEKLSPSLICLEDSLYVDERNLQQDYSTEISNWLQQHQKNVLSRKSMNTTFSQLWIRLGVPYVLLHSGDCEHVFVIQQIRRFNPTQDPPMQHDYPHFIGSQTTLQTQLGSCITCQGRLIRHVVFNSPLVATSPAKFCDSCFQVFHKSRGKKLCNRPEDPPTQFVTVWLSSQLVQHLDK